jgi:N-acetylneuraminic acid mutarotase
VILAIALGLPACGGDSSSEVPDASLADAAPPAWSPAPPLPAALSNNTVAAVDDGDACTLYTAMGIGGALTGADIVASTAAWSEGDAAWRTLPDLPSSAGRVAGSSVALRGKLYVLGGYSVGPGTTETSFAAVDVFDPASGQWSSAPDLPIAIDDAVAVTWRDRWIVVVSGWSTNNNVDAVQIYDAETNSWAMGTAFPGTAAFGHAGAIVGDSLLVIDGVGTAGGFTLVNQAWLATLDPANPTTISWTDLGMHPGPLRYRAAGGDTASGMMWFHGGTADAYNFNGLSYDTGLAAPPEATTLTFDPVSRTFATLGVPKPTATMDHRSLARCGRRIYSVGGMVAGPAATSDTWVIEGP